MARFQLRSVALTITFVLGFLMIVEYFISFKSINDLAANIRDAATVIIGLASIVGVGNITRNHLRNISRRGDNWIPSIIMLVSVWIPLVIGLLGTQNHPIYRYVFVNLFNPVGNAFFAVLGFYILSGAWRAFRVKSLDGTVMVLCAALIFLKNAPVAGYLWSGFNDIGAWIMNVFQAAGYRGIIIGVAIGSITTGLRILLGRETGYLAERRGGQE